MPGPGAVGVEFVVRGPRDHHRQRGTAAGQVTVTVANPGGATPPNGSYTLVARDLGGGQDGDEDDEREDDDEGTGGDEAARRTFTVDIKPPAGASPARPATPAAIRLPRPRTFRAGLLRPRPGARPTSRRPLLRWRARRGARLYNVQIFALRGGRVNKVVSAFPRDNRFRPGGRRLRFGVRYVWRVWPLLRADGFPRRPLGVSYFDLVRRR
jgi:hypothetical protein